MAGLKCYDGEDNVHGMPMDLQRKTCGPGVLNCIRIFASKNRYIDIDNKSIFVWFSGGQLVKGEVYCQDEIMSTFNQRDKFYFPFQYNLSSNPIQWNVNIDNVQRERGKRLKSHPFHHFKSSILLYNPFVCICSCGLTRKYLIVLILVLRSCEPECIDTHVGVRLRDQDVQERLCAR